MISISAEAKQKYIKDSQPKELVIGYCHKDGAEIANINMGLPVDALIYQQGIAGYSAYVTPSNPNIFVMSRSWTWKINVVNTSIKHIYFNFKFRVSTLDLTQLHDTPNWRLIYKNFKGETVFNRYYIPDASIYKVQSGSEVTVDIDFDISDGIEEFISLSLDCYKNTITEHNEGVGFGQVRVLYSYPNKYNLKNRIMLSDIPDYDFTDYETHYITKDNLEEETFSITESLSSKDNLKYGLCEAGVCEFTVVNYDGIEVGDLVFPQVSLNGVANSTVPLGVYVVQSIQKTFEGSLEKKKITAYTQLTKLENKAYNWSSIYMYGINTVTSDGQYTGRGFEFARQIYSSVYSALNFFGIENISRYNNVEIKAEYTTRPARDNTFWIEWYVQSNWAYKIHYASMTIANPDTSVRYLFTYKNALGVSDAEMAQSIPRFMEKYDTLGRGIEGANVLVEETSTGGVKHRYLVDKNDAFMISDNCVQLKIYFPRDWDYTSSGGQSGGSGWICDNSDTATLYTIAGEDRLANGAERLMYYNYMSRVIFPIDTSANGRDVVRSILEMTGCYFTLDRLTGKPRFKYPDKSGLYPSNTLYPSDTLYPRSAISESYGMGRYETLRAEDYSVASIGKIQIVKKEESNDVASCVWEHVGSNAPNTYIIDDNIYYCAEDMEYDYDLMIDVSRVLTNMFFEITNNNYTPFKAVLIGLPWQECGDRINIETFNGNFETFIYRRKLKGIDLLKDTYEAKGDKLTQGVNKYLYTQEE